MIKENKFRAYDIALKKMIVTGFHVFGEVTMFNMIESYLYENPIEKHHLMDFNRVEVHEFTGLKDHNGIDIYERDILYFQTYEGGGFGEVGIDCYAEVVFGEHNLTDNSLFRSQGFYILTGKSHHPTSIHYWLSKHKAVIIGTVMNNPELLGLE